jgi:DNA-binding MarR family transcriptional regulator
MREERPEGTVLGGGNSKPLTAVEKRVLFSHADELSRPTEKGKHYGAVTPKGVMVLEALLWGCRSYPTLKALAEAANCSESTAARAVKALTAAGLLERVGKSPT